MNPATGAFRWISLWGHDPCKGCVEKGAVVAVVSLEHSYWSLRWSSLWGHEASEGCAEMSTAAPYALGPLVELWGTKRQRGVPR